jgi:hypothetical protein
VLTLLLVPVSNEEVGQVEAEGEDNRQEAPSRYTQQSQYIKVVLNTPETISNRKNNVKNTAIKRLGK